MEMEIDNINHKIGSISISSNKDEIINVIKSKYNFIHVDNIVQYFYDKLGYNSISMPKEKEIRVKNYLNQKINTNSIDSYSNKTINQLISDFYRSQEYSEFINEFNKKLSRSLFLHTYINHVDVEGFLENCTKEELEYLVNF